MKLHQVVQFNVVSRSHAINLSFFLSHTFSFLPIFKYANCDACLRAEDICRKLLNASPFNLFLPSSYCVVALLYNNNIGNYTVQLCSIKIHACCLVYLYSPMLMWLSFDGMEIVRGICPVSPFIASPRK